MLYPVSTRTSKHYARLRTEGKISACSRRGKYVQKALSVCTHLCSHCSFVADRDVNAAINILQAWTRPARSALAEPAKFEAEYSPEAAAMQLLLWSEAPCLFASNFGVAAHSHKSRDNLNIYSDFRPNIGFGSRPARGAMTVAHCQTRTRAAHHGRIA